MAVKKRKRVYDEGEYVKTVCQWTHNDHIGHYVWFCPTCCYALFKINGEGLAEEGICVYCGKQFRVGKKDIRIKCPRRHFWVLMIKLNFETHSAAQKGLGLSRDLLDKFISGKPVDSDLEHGIITKLGYLPVNSVYWKDIHKELEECNIELGRTWQGRTENSIPRPLEKYLVPKSTENQSLSLLVEQKLAEWHGQLKPANWYLFHTPSMSEMRRSTSTT
jgi:hypothetical protein